MAINIYHHIVIDDSPALAALIKLVKKIIKEKENEKLRQQMMEKLDKIIVDLKSTV